METRKLYYEDCHLAQFHATVLGCEEAKGGYAVTLDATAFYPEGGGQSWDLGTLGTANVLQVTEKEGKILHLCDAPLTLGETVEGRLDYERRFDLMQQHSGEHMVSGVVHRMYGYHNVGFHMGAEVITIDFDGVIPAEALAEIENKVNAMIWQNLPISCTIPSKEALAAISYRCKRVLDWPVRLVDIPGVDMCACCGTHVAFTGEVGLVKILSCVKFHQGVRIELLCGQRALRYLSRVYEQNKQVSQAFSAKLLETGEAARHMNDQLAAQKLRLAQLEKQLVAAIAKEYEGQDFALCFAPELSSAALGLLAESIQAKLRVVLMGEDGAYQLCIAGDGAVSLGQLLKQALNCRGGGRDGFFQGRIAANKAEIIAFFRENQN